jgi:hypothetical protein
VKKSKKKLNQPAVIHWNQGDLGPMLRFLKIFSPKYLAKILEFLLKLLLVFAKNANFFSPKIGKDRRKL